MATQYSVKTKKINKYVLLIIVAAIVLSIAILILWLTGLLNSNPDAYNIGFPGSAKESTVPAWLDEAGAKEIEGKMISLLKMQDGSLASSYQLAGSAGQPPAEISGSAYLSDQLLYGQFLLEQAREKDFSSWWDDLRRNYLEQSSEIQPFTTEQTDCMVRDNLLLLRLLAQSCAIWPDQERYSELLKISGSVLELFRDGIPESYIIAIPTPGPVPDPAATPTPKPTAEPEPKTDERPRLSVLRISSIDLYTLKMLGDIDSRWNELYEQYLPLVQGAYLSDDLPLFAAGYDLETGSYIPYAGETPVVSLEESLLTMLHLSEIGAVPDRAISWIMDQIYNQRAVYLEYHLTLGTAASDQESLPSYAMICRIARIRADQALYEQSARRLLWHQATSRTSEALHAIFRENKAGKFQVWASDNVWTLLAIR